MAPALKKAAQMSGTALPGYLPGLIYLPATRCHADTNLAHSHTQAASQVGFVLKASVNHLRLLFPLLHFHPLDK